MLFPQEETAWTLVLCCRKCEFAVEECLFLSVGGGAAAHTLKYDNPVAKKLLNFIIILDERIAPEDFESTVAHEIAHAFLPNCADHQLRIEERIVEGKPEQVIVNEFRAYTQAAEWGLTGSGADVRKAIWDEDWLPGNNLPK